MLIIFLLKVIHCYLQLLFSRKRMENPKTINVSFHSCPLEFHKAKGAFKACDLCETDFKIGEMKYRCRQHAFDLCLKCYSKHVNKGPNLDANERARLQQMVDDPKARQVLN